MNNMQIENTILQVPIEDIIPNRFQPRLAFDDASLNDLASSIKQHGIIQPLVLRRKNDKYEIIAGERRYKAAKVAGLASVPAVISNLDDNESAEVAIVENIQRKDLTSIEEARSYQALLDKGYITQEELARKMGLSQSAISNKLRLLTLDESIQEAILAEKISERHARTLLKVPSHDKQRELLTRIINERLTVKQLEDVIKNMDNNGDNLTLSHEIKENQAIENVDNLNICEIEPERIEPMENLESLDTVESLNDVLNIEEVPTSIEEMFSDGDLLNPSDIITDLEKQSEDFTDEVEEIELMAPTTTPDAFFSNPEKMPNKFFNFLEDTAVNMGMEEITPNFELEPQISNEEPEDIEMLDDFIIPDTKTDDKIMQNDYLDYVIKTIRGLNLDSDKVLVEEMNLPTEYRINIKIKKDKI